MERKNILNQKYFSSKKSDANSSEIYRRGERKTTEIKTTC